MGKKKAGSRVEERAGAENEVAFISSPTPDHGGSGFYVPINPLRVGPGEPGPGDEWHVDVTPEPAAPADPEKR